MSRLERFKLRSPAQLRALVAETPDAAWVRDLGMSLGLPDPLPPATEPPAVPRAADGLSPDFGALPVRDLKRWLDAHGASYAGQCLPRMLLATQAVAIPGPSYAGLSEKQELVSLCREVAAAASPAVGAAGPAPAEAVDVEAGMHSLAAIVRDSTIAMGCQACGRSHGAEGPDSQLLTCGRCRAARYCSAACQRENWATHKKFCKLVAPKQAAAAAGADPEASLSTIASSLSASFVEESAARAPPSEQWLADARAAEEAFRKANRLD